MTTLLLLLTTSVAPPVAPLTSAASGTTPHAVDECQSLPRPQMRVRLTLTTEAPIADLVVPIKTMVGQVWLAEGIDIEWAPPVRSGNGWHDTDLWVVVKDGSLSSAPSDALGTIFFASGQPQRLILVSADAALAWVHRAEAARFHTAIPRFQTMTLGNTRELMRMALGYAVAHEIGHYVLSSRDHAAAGLMRATVFSPHTLDEAGALALDRLGRVRLGDRLKRGASCR